MEVVKGGGFELLTEDPVMVAVVRRCAELEEALRRRRRRHHYGTSSVPLRCRSVPQDGVGLGLYLIE